MKISAAKRIKAVRELLGITRQGLCDLVGLDYLRVSTLENDRARMSVEELASLIKVFPEFTNYMIFGEALEVQLLENSKNKLCNDAAFRIQCGEIPDGYGLEEVVVYGRQSE